MYINDRRVERAVLDWRSALAGTSDSTDSESDRRIRIGADRARVSHDDGYILTVTTDGVDVLGGCAAGCAHGLRTLTQLTRFEAGEVPCCTIIDRPDFATRGLLLDVTRGRVPTLDTLKRTADRLAALKVNQLQLNLEHAFAFNFDPYICGPEDGLTPDEVRELDRYCRDRFIDLVPALATLGHMGRVLSMPRYRHLAEVETHNTWSEMSWPERMRGLTLDCANPEAHRLIERMWSEVLDAFSAPVVNICGDEPWDLGQGKNRQRFAGQGKGEPYVEHLRRTHDVCAVRDRRTQFWSDVILNYPDLLDRLPRDSTVLHWGYDDRADYEGTGRFVAAGLDTFVCPGTSGWKRIINAVGLAERNIARFAAAGCRHGASGLLNTDWGDYGHFNLPACSGHGVALGAALGWNADHATGGEFDRRFTRACWGIDDNQGVSLLRAASAIAQRCETWRLLWMPLRQIVEDPTLPTVEEANRSGENAREALKWFEKAVSVGAGDSHDLKELALACRFTELFADRVIFAHLTHEAPQALCRARQEREAWADRLDEATRDYAALWRARHKESGLGDIIRALNTVGDEIRSGVS